MKVDRRKKKGVEPGGQGKQDIIEGDIVAMTTGFGRPQLVGFFLPGSCFQKPYGPAQLVSPDIPTQPSQHMHQLHVHERD